MKKWDTQNSHTCAQKTLKLALFNYLINFYKNILLFIFIILKIIIIIFWRSFNFAPFSPPLPFFPLLHFQSLDSAVVFLSNLFNSLQSCHLFAVSIRLFSIFQGFFGSLIARARCLLQALVAFGGFLLSSALRGGLGFVFRVS